VVTVSSFFAVVVVVFLSSFLPVVEERAVVVVVSSDSEVVSVEEVVVLMSRITSELLLSLSFPQDTADAAQSMAAVQIAVSLKFMKNASKRIS